MLKVYGAVMCGGAAGVAARMWLANLAGERWNHVTGILIVNVLGCFVIGLFSGLTGPDARYAASPLIRQVVMIGVLGGFTTFSSFGLQTIQLMNDGKWLYAGMNILLSVVLCLLAVWIGLLIAGQINGR